MVQNAKKRIFELPWLEELVSLRRKVFMTQQEFAETCTLSLNTLKAAEVKCLATKATLRKINGGFRTISAESEVHAEVASRWQTIYAQFDQGISFQDSRSKIRKYRDSGANIKDHPVLSVIKEEVNALSEEMAVALQDGNWEPASDAWTHAIRTLGEIRPRHGYMELMSLIPPDKWKSGQWAAYNDLLVERTSRASPDAIRRLHIFSAQLLPDSIQEQKRFSDDLRKLCKEDSGSAPIQNSVREIRELLIAEYISGIRARVLFLCPSQISDNNWPRFENAYLLDAGTYYQTGPRYRVILSNLKPLEQEYPETDLIVYRFRHDLGTERLYWLLRANYFRLLRSNSNQLFDVFELFEEAADIKDLVDWDAVRAFVPACIREHLPHDLTKFVANSFKEARKAEIAREYTFEKLLKERLQAR